MEQSLIAPSNGAVPGQAKPIGATNSFSPPSSPESSATGSLSLVFSSHLPCDGAGQTAREEFEDGLSWATRQSAGNDRPLNVSDHSDSPSPMEGGGEEFDVPALSAGSASSKTSSFVELRAEDSSDDTRLGPSPSMAVEQCQLPLLPPPGDEESCVGLERPGTSPTVDTAQRGTGVAGAASPMGQPEACAAAVGETTVASEAAADESPTPPEIALNGPAEEEGKGTEALMARANTSLALANALVLSMYV